jgi:hypothetical protein
MHVSVRHSTLLPGVLLALALSAAPAAAQSLFGSILGTVTDNSKAVVPGALVKIRSVETNAVRTVQTDPAGDYQAPSLPVGTYQVSCEVAGFKRAVVDGVVLEVDQRARIDFKLELGGVGQQVEVFAAAAIMETDTASQGTVIDNRTIVDLPLNGRNFEQLAVLGPGVTAPVAGAGNRRSTSSPSPDPTPSTARFLNSSATTTSMPATSSIPR